ncbi:MAG: nitrilase family protein [Alistipes sp.]|nr:nitrilase family protein [Alistipes sp.]
MELKVALCQTAMEWENPQVNLRRIERMLVGVDADLVVLPEMFATGFVTDPARVAQPMSGGIVSWMRERAQDAGCALAGSLVVEEGGRYFNRLLFAMPSGGLVCYDKRHLFSIGGEGEAFTPGASRTVVEYGGFLFLLLICYDLRFPVWSRCRGDYDAILCVASWPESRREAWRTLLRARAIENQAYVLGVNRTGSDPTARYSGDSVAVGFMGETFAEADDAECVLQVALDRERLVRFRERFPAWRDADAFSLEG